MSKKKSFRNLSNYLAPLSDNEEAMQLIRKLLKEKESLEKSLKVLNEDCDIMLTFIGCSSHEEREAVTEEWLEVHSLRMSPPILDEKVLHSFIDAKQINSVHQFLGITVRQSDSGEIIIVFLSPKDYIPPSPAFITRQIIDGMYNYKLSKWIQSFIPTPELKKYSITSNEGTKSALIFIAQKYIWAFWMRDMHIQKVKDLPYMNDSIIYYNNDRTLVTFSLSLMSKFLIEVKMKYKLHFIIPDEVTYTEYENKQLPSDIISKLEELKEKLELYPFSVVIKQVIGTGPDVNDTSSQISDASEQTVIFDLGLFK